MSADGDRMMSAQRAFKTRRRGAKTDRCAGARILAHGLLTRRQPKTIATGSCPLPVDLERGMENETVNDREAMSFRLRCLIRSTLWILLALSALVVFAVCIHEAFGQACCPPGGSSCGQGSAATSQGPPITSVVKIISTRGDEQRHGTGTCIDAEGGETLILTCSHILRAGYAPSVRFPDGTVAPAAVIATDSMNDLALLVTTGKPPRYAGPADAAPVTGATVAWCGWSGRHGWTMGEGRVLGYDGDFVRFGGQVDEGTSGGPVYLANGKLVGVIVETAPAQLGQAAWTRGCGIGPIRRFVAKHWPRKGRVGRAAAVPGTTAPPWSPPAVSLPGPDSQVLVPVVPPAVLAPVPDIGADIQPPPIPDDIRTRLDRLGGLVGTIKAQVDGLPAADAIKQGAAQVALAAVEVKIAALAPAATGAATGWLMTLGLAAGPAGLIAAGGTVLAIGLAKRAAKKVALNIVRRGTTSTIPAGAAANVSSIIPSCRAVSAALSPQLPAIDVSLPMPPVARPPSTPSRPIVVTTESPPLPQELVRETQYVQVPTVTARQQAIEEAMVQLVRHSPGAQSVVETIQAYARQIESGLRAQPKN